MPSVNADQDIPRWSVVLPVKGGAAAKSRLVPGGDGREELARAVATDTLDAVLRCGVVTEVLVVTADAATSRWARLRGARAVGETSPGAGLLAAVQDGLRSCRPGPAAVLLADLPALTPADLDSALHACWPVLRTAPMAYVPDAGGTGTVLLAAADPGLLRPAFGPGSAAAHQALGAARLDLALPRLRRDVDTASELAEAAALGLGAATRATLAGCRPPCATTTPAPPAAACCRTTASS